MFEFKSDRIITLDIGASKVILAEFLVSHSSTAPQLLNYGISALGVEAGSDADPSPYIVAALKDLTRELNIKPAPLFMSIPGQMVFPRFVKMPPVSMEKVAQIVRYEAEQNVPFPISEVIWDYQLMGGEEGELNVMLVAVKTEYVKMLSDCVRSVGLEPEIIEAVPMSLYNVVRYNYQDDVNCTMILDIGARATDLIIFEKNKMYCRSIPVAGKTITQEIAKEFNISPAEAESLKLHHAFVAFGGVYAGPDSEDIEKISKVVRNVVTRLHAEVNRSINFYRSQYDGSHPQRLLLTGGTAVIPHMDTFFREKFRINVELLNPFVNIAVSDTIDSDRLTADIIHLASVTGLALRSNLKCPVETNLLPPELVARKEFRRRLPYLILSLLGLGLIFLCGWIFAFKMEQFREAQILNVEKRIENCKGYEDKIRKVVNDKKQMEIKINEIANIVRMRNLWFNIINNVHESLLDGMWLIRIEPIFKADTLVAVDIEGAGFEDKLRKFDTTEKTAVEILRDRLRKCKEFSEKTEITREKFAGGWREFILRIYLKEPASIFRRENNDSQS